MRGDAGLSPFSWSHGGASGPHSCRRKGKSPVAPPPPTPVLGFSVPRISTPLPITVRLWHQTGLGVPASVCSFLLLPPWSLYVSSPGPHPPRTPAEGCRFHSPWKGGRSRGEHREGLVFFRPQRHFLAPCSAGLSLCPVQPPTWAEDPPLCSWGNGMGAREAPSGGGHWGKPQEVGAPLATDRGREVRTREDSG